MTDTAWVQLRQTLATEVEAMRWRLEAMSEEEREDLLDELTDRLYSKVRLAD